MYAVRALSRAGFTLIEILVTLILLSLLVAAVFPIVTQQLGQADAPRLANDLVSIRSGVEAFSVNMRRGVPGDLEDLAFKPDSGDMDVNGVEFLNGNQDQIDARWNGPYADFTVTANSTTETGDVVETGFDAFLDNELICYDPAVVLTDGSGERTAGSCAAGDFVTVKINHLEQTDFVKVNELFDGSSETTSTMQFGLGKLRCKVSGANCAPAYYLAVPFRP